MNEHFFEQSGRFISAWARMMSSAAGFVVHGSASLLFDEDQERRRAGHASRGPNRGASAGSAAEQRRVTLMVATVLLAARMARAGGTAPEEAFDELGRVFDISPEERVAAEKLYRLARTSAAGLESYVSQIAGFLGRGTALFEQLLRSALPPEARVSEQSLIERLALLLGLDTQAFARLADRVAGSGQEDPRRVLGVPPDASHEEIRAAYRLLVREHHPDRLMGAGESAELVSRSAERMVEINVAYAQLIRKP